MIGILQNLLKPETTDRLALAFNQMRMRPDPNLPQIINARQDLRKAQAGRDSALAFFNNRKGADPYIAALNAGGDGAALIQSYINAENARQARAASTARSRGDVNKTVELFQQRCDQGDQAACDVVLGAQTNSASLTQLIGIYNQEKASGRKVQQSRFYPGGFEVKQFGDGRTVFFKNGVELVNADEILEAQKAVQKFEAEGEGMNEQAVQTARAAADLRAAIKGVRERIENTAPLVKELMNHPGMAGAVGTLFNSQRQPNSFSEGAPEREFIAKYDQLAGKIFLSAFEGLKGGGQITELEGIKAQAAASSISRTLSVPQLQSAMRQYIVDLVAQHQRLMAQNANSAPQELPEDILNSFPDDI